MQTWAERDRGGAVSNEEIGLTFSSGAMFAPGDYKSGQTTDILVLPFFLRLRDGFTPSIGTAKQIGKDARELFAARSVDDVDAIFGGNAQRIFFDRKP